MSLLILNLSATMDYSHLEQQSAHDHNLFYEFFFVYTRAIGPHYFGIVLLIFVIIFSWLLLLRFCMLQCLFLFQRACSDQTKPERCCYSQLLPERHKLAHDHAVPVQTHQTIFQFDLIYHFVFAIHFWGGGEQLLAIIQPVLCVQIWLGSLDYSVDEHVDIIASCLVFWN